MTISGSLLNLYRSSFQNTFERLLPRVFYSRLPSIDASRYALETPSGENPLSELRKIRIRVRLTPFGAWAVSPKV